MEPRPRGIVAEARHDTHGRLKWVAVFCFGFWACQFRSLSFSRCCGGDMQINATTYPLGSPDTAESSVSAISWSAIFAGSVVAASTPLVLLLIGAGFGFACMSPWLTATT